MIDLAWQKMLSVAEHGTMFGQKTSRDAIFRL
jgi:hypothetical protein